MLNEESYRREAKGNTTMNTKPFATIPDNAKVNEVDRDLTFHPSEVTHPRVLDRSQIDHFNRDGFVKGIAVFDDAEIAEHRGYFDELLSRVISEGGDSYSISTAHVSYGKVYDLITDSRIVDCAADILGENVVAWGSHYFCKMPGDTKTVSWHQDASYWPMSPSKTVTVWLAIDDADCENACMRFIPGTHQIGPLTYELTEDSNVLNQTIPDIDQYGDPIDVELKAGQVSLHSDLLLHGSEANKSDRRRCGLTLRYCAAEVRAYMDWDKKGIIVRGSDPSGHWGNPSRPEQE